MSVYPYLYCALNCPHHDRIHGDGQIPKCCVHDQQVKHQRPHLVGQKLDGLVCFLASKGCPTGKIPAPPVQIPQIAPGVAIAVGQPALSDGYGAHAQVVQTAAPFAVPMLPAPQSSRQLEEC